MTEIFAGASWYQDRPEAEREWKGVLQKRTAPPGPNTRLGLGFTFSTDEMQYPVYAANVEQQLAAFLGDTVIVRGKLVDLSPEGFGQELWIASIRRLEDSSK